jgi:hypothetical protein
MSTKCPLKARALRVRQLRMRLSHRAAAIATRANFNEEGVDGLRDRSSRPLSSFRVYFFVAVERAKTRQKRDRTDERA